jgi:hypothetical protein
LKVKTLISRVAKKVEVTLYCMQISMVSFFNIEKQN